MVTGSGNSTNGHNMVFTSTESVPNSTITSAPYYAKKIFLQTTAAQAIAGVFAFCAFFITCHQVNCSFPLC